MQLVTSSVLINHIENLTEKKMQVSVLRKYTEPKPFPYIKHPECKTTTCNNACKFAMVTQLFKRATNVT